MINSARWEEICDKREDTYCYLPTEEDIRRETAIIRENWTDKERRRRAGYRTLLPQFDLDRLTMFNSSGRPFNL